MVHLSKRNCFQFSDEKFQPSLSISCNNRQKIEQNLDGKPDISFYSGKSITDCHNYTHKRHYHSTVQLH